MRSSQVVPSRLANGSAAAFLDDRSARMFGLSDNRKEGGGAGLEGAGERKIARDTPLWRMPHSEIAREHSAAKCLVAVLLAVCDHGLPLKWDAFRLRPALLSQYYVQHLFRRTPGRTECIGRDGRYFRDTCGIFVPCHLPALVLPGPERVRVMRAQSPGNPARPSASASARARAPWPSEENTSRL